MNIKKLNEELKQAIREANGKEYTFADWFGQDLTGQTYEGDINCWGKGLTSLQGAPEKVIGDFWCRDNKLKSLQGAPEYVSGSFNCGWNKLTSLQGAPKEVGGDFGCDHNKLTNLQGAPEKVGASFNCDSSKLTSLEGAPEYVGGWFDCEHNKLTSLEGAPKYVGASFTCYYNPNLKSLDGIGEVKGKIFSKVKPAKSRIITDYKLTKGEQLQIIGITKVQGETSYDISSDEFLNLNKKEQRKKITEIIDDNSSDFYIDEDSTGYGADSVTLNELTITNISTETGIANGIWLASVYDEYNEVEKEIKLRVSFHLNFI